MLLFGLSWWVLKRYYNDPVRIMQQKLSLYTYVYRAIIVSEMARARFINRYNLSSNFQTLR